MKNDEVSGLGVWENWGAVNHIRGLYLGDMGKQEMLAKIIYASASHLAVHPSTIPSIFLLPTCHSI